MKRIQNRWLSLLATGAMLVATACDFDVTNPNSATEDEVANTLEGLKAVAVGMQRSYASSVVESAIVFHGVTSREVVVNNTYYNQEVLELGGPTMSGAAGDVGGSFSRSITIMRMSGLILDNAEDITMNPGTRSGLLALAHLYRAMALGHLAIAFEQAPLELDISENASFVPRLQVLDAGLQHLQQAEALLTATPPSTEFNSTVLGNGFDMLNVLRLYRARFLLMTGKYAEALTAVNTVSPTSVSYFRYDDTYRNPVFRQMTELKEYVPRDGMGPPAAVETGDKRLAFFLTADAGLSKPDKKPYDKVLGFFTSASSPIPVYRPGEIALIKAEAYLRANNLTAAVAEIDKVRTKKAAQDPLGLGADLPAYSGPITAAAIENEIFHQRAAELFLGGTRWEDARRLNQPGPLANPEMRNRNFYPYADQERLNNPNTPPNPAI